MQYWKPDAPDEFVGDMMPLWDGEIFHLFYLLDRDHHSEQGGLGGHQWAHASSRDLVRWQHHPLALPIGAKGEVDQHGICTGSIFRDDATSTWRAFYATRIRREDGSVLEAVCQASSADLIHFRKSLSNPMFGAPQGLSAGAHRDPHVFRDLDGGFHMLVTAVLAGQGERGVLAHYTARDLDNWSYQDPFLPLEGPSPECPEHFEWNGWFYLLLSQHAQLQYWIARDPLGPWQRARRHTIEGPSLSVPRTAAFGQGRRIAVGFLPWKVEDRDAGGWAYAGNAIFRELMQDSDGTLSTRFVPEMMPTTQAAREEGAVLLATDEAAQVREVPLDCAITVRLVPQGAREFGLLLRADAEAKQGYRLLFEPGEKRVSLERWPDTQNVHAQELGVENLERGVEVSVCLKGSVIDVCINNRRTLVARGFDFQGTKLGLFAHGGAARVERLSVAPLA